MDSSHSLSSLSTRSETPSSILPDDSSSIAESESFKASSSVVGVAEDDWVASDISVGEEEQASLNSCKILCEVTDDPAIAFFIELLHTGSARRKKRMVTCKPCDNIFVLIQ